MSLAHDVHVQGNAAMTCGVFLVPVSNLDNIGAKSQKTNVSNDKVGIDALSQVDSSVRTSTIIRTLGIASLSTVVFSWFLRQLFRRLKSRAQS